MPRNRQDLWIELSGRLRGGFLVLLVAFDDHPLLEVGDGSDESDEVGAVERSPPVLGGFDELEGHGEPRGPDPGPFVTRVRRPELPWI